MVDANQLSILTVQTTHLDDTAVVHTNRWFKLSYSVYTQSPCSTAGVGFVLNKKFVDTENIHEYHLIPRQALMIMIPWYKGEVLNILNTYAPNM